MINGFGTLGKLFLRMDALMKEFEPLLEEVKRRRKPNSMVSLTEHEDMLGWSIRMETVDEVQMAISHRLDTRHPGDHYIIGCQVFFDTAHDKPFGHGEDIDDDYFMMLSTQELRDLHTLIGMYLDRLDLYQSAEDW